MFKLRELPFDAAHNAVVSKQTCHYHHGKHHATYVANLNKLTESGEFAGKGLYEIVTAASGGLFNNAAQVYNHDFYWDCIAKPSEPSAELKSALAENFADFKSEFLAAATAHFGSGWVWLAYDPKSGKLCIKATQNAATPVTEGLVPLLVVDVWEHAYYIDEHNARPKYLEKFYAGINWEFVSSAYEWAKKEGLGSVKFYIDELHGRD
nr:superoxide dismutase [Fe] [uncultured Campylobacter sp.]